LRRDVKAGCYALFAWLGIPALFALVSALAYSRVPRLQLPASFPTHGFILVSMFVLVATGVFAIREGQRPQSAWVSPLYVGSCSSCCTRL
jgi:hypothetical protein